MCAYLGAPPGKAEAWARRGRKSFEKGWGTCAGVCRRHLRFNSAYQAQAVHRQS